MSSPATDLIRSPKPEFGDGRIDTLRCPCGSMWELRRGPGFGTSGLTAACRREGGGKEIVNRVADHYRVFPRELLGGPEGSPKLPWNHDRHERRPRQRRGSAPDPHLTQEQVDTYAAALLDSPEILRYLRARGITRSTVVEYRFGFGQPVEYRPPGIVLRSPRGRARASSSRRCRSSG